MTGSKCHVKSVWQKCRSAEVPTVLAFPFVVAEESPKHPDVAEFMALIFALTGLTKAKLKTWLVREQGWTVDETRQVGRWVKGDTSPRFETVLVLMRLVNEQQDGKNPIVELYSRLEKAEKARDEWERAAKRRQEEAKELKQRIQELAVSQRQPREQPKHGSRTLRDDQDSHGHPASSSEESSREHAKSRPRVG